MSSTNKTLEDEFRRIVRTVGPQIEDKIERAVRLIEEAKQLSKESGLPFSVKLIGEDNTYVPDSFDRFFTLDADFVNNLVKITKADDWQDWNPGWEHSNRSC